MIIDSVVNEGVEQQSAARRILVYQVPGPNLDNFPAHIDTDDRRICVRTVVQMPRIVVFGNLLSEKECNALIALARPRLKKSETMDLRTGGNVPNAVRTSATCFFELQEFDVCARIERRLAQLLNWPVSHAEGIQVLRYGIGEQYMPHHDFFDPRQPGTEKLLRLQGQRVATMLLYLKSPERGGATTFPYAGLDVAAERGTGVFFSYDRPHPSTRTLHAGKPVISGEKFVATKWFLDRAWTQPIGESE